MTFFKPDTITLLTDRWGDTHVTLTADDAAAVDALLPLMWDEVSFVARIGGAYGLLIEGEFDDGIEPDAATRERWSAVASEGAFFEIVEGDGDHIPVFNDRFAAWAFFPMAVATAPAVEKAGRDMLALLYLSPITE